MHALLTALAGLIVLGALAGAARADGLPIAVPDGGLEGVPILDGCLASFECRTTHRLQAGDHWLFLGAVERFAYRTGAPLVFFTGRYGLPPADHRGRAEGTPPAAPRQAPPAQAQEAA